MKTSDIKAARLNPGFIRVLPGGLFARAMSRAGLLADTSGERRDSEPRGER